MLVIGVCRVQGATTGLWGWSGCTSERAEMGATIKWRCGHIHTTQKAAESCAFAAVQQARREGRLKKLGFAS